MSNALNDNRNLEDWRNLIHETEEKYELLVWYARKTPEIVEKYPQIAPRLKEIEAQYPEETEALSDDDRADWQHGFNSGVLACVRLIRDAGSRGSQAALEDFPNCDS